MKRQHRLNTALNKKVAEALYTLVGDTEDGDDKVLRFLMLEMNEEQSEFTGELIALFQRYCEHVNSYKPHHGFGQ